MAWYLMAWQRAADFSGRSRRTEYWMFQLFNILAALALGFVAFVTGVLFGQAGRHQYIRHMHLRLWRGELCPGPRRHHPPPARHRQKRLVVFHCLCPNHRRHHPVHIYSCSTAIPTETNTARTQRSPATPAS